MKRYIALLRGINISSKNKIAMSALKAEFTELGFADVYTYLNSGNVVFGSEVHDEKFLADKIRSMIKEKFCLDIPVYVLLQEELQDILGNAPNWWDSGNKEIYDNIIFIMPPLTYDELYNDIGSPKDEYEKICSYKNIVFWSFSRKDYRKTNWWSKTASSNVSGMLTIRTANTLKKIAEM
ncbi:MAG: DUF1697 domain-containing protein [Oscillospiraceae bacterium]|nr:DUF1697 domain-containing protein [Oscillospiraceae bacterium]